MQFIQNNWPLILVMLISGGMLLWPLVGRRFSKVGEVGALQATQLINRQNALMLDLREAKDFDVVTNAPPAVVLHLFPGASGGWRGKQARRAISCVKRAFAAPDWTTIQHQYRFYTIAVLATYVPPNAPPSAAGVGAAPHNPLATPNFE